MVVAGVAVAFVMIWMLLFRNRDVLQQSRRELPILAVYREFWTESDSAPTSREDTDMQSFVDKTLAVTGPTGMVGAPLVAELAKNNRIIALARFSDDAARSDLEAKGVECHQIDFAKPDFSSVPGEVDAVLNLAVAKTGDWCQDLAANAEAAGHLVSHFRGSGAFFHCSTGAVNKPNGGEPFEADGPHGDHHQNMLPTYSISKIAAESVVRFAAAEFKLPTVIARLNVPYSDNGGWPWFHLHMMRAEMDIDVHTDGARYNLIHAEDIAADLPVLLGEASVDPTTINWASPDVVSVEEWCSFMAELDGCPPPRIKPSDHALPSTVMNLSHMTELRPERNVDWRDGIQRLVEATK